MVIHPKEHVSLISRFNVKSYQGTKHFILNFNNPNIPLVTAMVNWGSSLTATALSDSSSFSSSESAGLIICAVLKLTLEA